MAAITTSLSAAIRFSLRSWLPLIAVVALGGALRFFAALNNNRFWFDEIVTVAIAQKPLAEMWRYLALENHPPFHYYFMHWWIGVMGSGEVAVKMSSVIAGMLGVAATYGFGRRLFGNRAGIAAAALCALSAFQIFYSAEARMYAWLYLFSVLSFWSFWHLLVRPHWRTWGIWMLATLLALYTHLGAVFVPFVEFVYFFLLFFWSKRSSPSPVTLSLTVRCFIYSLLSLGVLWLPWLAALAHEKLNTFNHNAWYFWVNTSLPFPLEATQYFFLFDSSAPILGFFGWLLVGTGLLFACFHISRLPNDFSFSIRPRADTATVFALVIYLLPLMAGFLGHVWIGKIYMAAAVGAYVLIGKGLAHITLPTPLPRWLFPAAVGALMMALCVGVVMDVRPAWKEVGAYLIAHEQDADAIVVISHSYELAVRHYYHGTLPVLPFYPLADDVEGDVLARVVRRNWYTLFTPENISELDTLVAGKRRIFVITIGQFYETERIATERLQGQGWQLQERESWIDNFTNPEVQRYVRP